MAGPVLAPLGVLFRHTQSEHPDAEEVLVLTFGHDLAFFERAVLGVAQLTGARLTIVADANMANHDVYAVRRAGTAYHQGLAHCSGAFHPKLLVIAGQDRATVAVGSGNLSISGWQGNDELWSVHHADAARASPVVAAVGGWLSDLAVSPVQLGAHLDSALKRVAHLLQRHSHAEGPERLVSSLDGPVLDQLPTRPVDELNVYAPFYDPGASALRALIDRLQPRFTRVAYQPELTQIDGPAVADLLAGRGEVIELETARYRHGKLIEWVIGDERWALTGSANISTAALLRDVRRGGNVELGVIAPTVDSLMPEGKVASATDLRAIPYRRRPEEAGPPTLILSATRGDAGIDIRFVRAIEQTAYVDLSHRDSHPDSWTHVAEVPAGSDRWVIADEAPGGSRVRLRLGDGTTSTISLVVDLESVMRLRRAVPAGPRAPEIGEVFTDPAAAEKLFRLLAESPIEGGSAVAMAVPRAGEVVSVATGVGWEEYLDRTQGRMGAATLAFALGLPMPKVRNGVITISDISWDDEARDEAGLIDGEVAEEIDEDENDDQRLAPPGLSKVAEAARARYRTVASRMVRDWADPDPAQRLLALRTTLYLVAAGAWSAGDDSWAEVVLDAVEGLVLDDAPPEYREAAGSLALLSLSVVSGVVSSTERDLLWHHYGRALHAAGHLVAYATEDRLFEYADGLSNRFPATSRTDIAFSLLERLTNTDPLTNVKLDLVDAGIAATIEGRVIDLAKVVPDPLLLALRVLEIAEEAAPVAIRAAGPEYFVNVVWRPPDLVVLQSTKVSGGYWVRHYVYPGGRKPGVDVRTDGKLNSDRQVSQSLPKDDMLPVATEVLRSVELGGLGPPRV